MGLSLTSNELEQWYEQYPLTSSKKVEPGNFLFKSNGSFMN